jgi:outer membrane protein assembly factor BamA
VALRMFALPGNRAETPTSTVMATLIYTEKRQLMASIVPQLFVGDDRYRVEGFIEHVHFPDTFFGIGNDAPRSGETYTRTTTGLGVRGMTRIRHGIFAGPTILVMNQGLSDIDPGGLIDAGPGRTVGFVTEIGGRLLVDRRDHPGGPRSGYYGRVGIGLSSPVFGSQHSFGRFEADGRAFIPVRRNDVLAMQVYGAFAPGNTPFTLLPQLGGDSMMRGHFNGRYRDHTYTAIQAEYRAPVWWRFGAAAFASVGQVAGSLDGILQAPVRWSAGGGMRFALNRRERLNVRVDYGIGPATSSFYVTLGEAF